MNDVIKNDYALWKECREFAAEILAEWRDENPGECPDPYDSEWSDRAHEYADGSQNVIYTYRALQICANCDTTLGEEFLEDIGMPENPTFEGLATLIVYGEMRARIEESIRELIEESDE